MDFRKVGIVGGGVRGKSIAQLTASAGIEVVVLEISESRALEAREELAEALDREIEKWGLTSSEKAALLKRISFVADPGLLSEVDLAVESIPDELEGKKSAMAMLGRTIKSGRVLITNTSTLSLTEIAAASGRPREVVGMHFLSAFTGSPLVEVVRALETSDEAFQIARDFATALGKQVVEVFDSPGYVTTRAMMPFINEAMHLVMEGVASAESTDMALRLAYDMKTGPLEYADRVGLDKIMTWMEHLFRELGELKYRPCPMLRKLVRAGHYGRRTGRGFFHWDEGGRRLRLGETSS